MGETSDTSTTPQGVAGVLAEFDAAEALQAAAARVRQEGFTRWDVHSPFPIHGIEQAMGIRFTRLPWLVLAGGIAGGTAALLMQWWMNAVNYPLVISGKPFFSLPANVPITFELIVLFSALAAFGGAMGLSRLPHFSHFVLGSGRFRRATTDGLFLSIAASDPKFDPSATPQWMASLGARAVEICPLATRGRDFPRTLPGILAVAAALALLPPLLLMLARQGKSDKPRIHLIQDMDFQPKYKAQAYSPLFPDDRAMRPPMPGTIAVGDLNADEHFYLGYRAGQTTDSAKRKAESGNPSDHQSSIINPSPPSPRGPARVFHHLSPSGEREPQAVDGPRPPAIRHLLCRVSRAAGGWKRDDPDSRPRAGGTLHAHLAARGCRPRAARRQAV